MVVEGLLGAAWSYAAGAYAYNLSRFQFDAGQKQSSTHQRQNLRIAQWNIFREDARDLFALTTANMSTYMVVGTLFFSLMSSLMYSCIKDYPVRPSWLMVVWGNCLLTAIAFAILSVWLAMHGTIMAHSASVKVLTQAIRLPIPTSAEVDAVRHGFHDYEGAGPGRFLQLPDFLGMRNSAANTGAAMPAPTGAAPDDRARGHANSEMSAMPSQAHPLASSPPGPQPQPPARQDTMTSVGSPNPESVATQAPRASRMDSSSGTHFQHAAVVQERAAQLLRDEEGGPGRGAAFDSHIRLFRQMHLTYACFDAYARISLSAAVHELLLVLAYLSVAHNMCKFDANHNPVQNKFFAWAVLGMVTVVNVILFKLDLYVEKTKMRIMKQAAFAGPVATGVAANLWSLRQQDGAFHASAELPALLIILACFLHFLWSVLLLWEARPMAGEFQLPLSWRSVRYLDVFGWMEDLDAQQQAERPEERRAREEAEQEFQRQLQEERMMAQKRAQAELLSQSRTHTRRLQRTIQRLLAGGAAAHLTTEHSTLLQGLDNNLDDIQQTLDELDGPSAPPIPGASCASMPSQRSSFAVGEDTWLECEYYTEAGQPVLYFVHASTGILSWEKPKDGKILNLTSITKAVDDVQRHVEICEKGQKAATAPSDTASEAATRPPLPAGAAVEMQDRGQTGSPVTTFSVDDRSDRRAVHFAEAEPVVFEAMSRRPGSSHDSASMPWKYFLQVCIFNIALWTLTTGWILVNEVIPNNPGGGALAPSLLATGLDDNTAQLVSAAWPHRFFRPSGVACSRQGELLLGDSFDLYTSDLSTLGARAEQEGESQSSIEKHQLVRSPASSLALTRLRVSNRSATWTSLIILDVVSGKPRRGLLLERGGGSVLEVELGTPESSVDDSAPHVSRRWSISQQLGGSLQAISLAIGKEAECDHGLEGRGGRGSNTSWALYGATDRGDIVLFCPMENTLEPLHVVAALAFAPARMPNAVFEEFGVPMAASAEDLLGFHFDGAGTLWAMVRSAGFDPDLEPRTELRAWAHDGSGMKGVWQLPPGRRWAPGLCALSKASHDDEQAGSGFLIAAEQSVQGSPLAHPELWRLYLDVTPVACDDAKVGTGAQHEGNMQAPHTSKAIARSFAPTGVVV